MAIIYRASRRELQWNPTWSGAVFPVCILGIAVSQLSIELQSPFLGILSCVLLVVCVVGFFVNMSIVFWYVFKGKLLVVREDRRVVGRLPTSSATGTGTGMGTGQGGISKSQ